MPDNIEDDRSATPPAAAAADNSSATTATGEEDGGIELTLDAVHDELEMTLSNAKKQTRSQATYYKHNLENVRFLLWAYENPDIKSIGEALDPSSFVAALDAIKANTHISRQVFQVPRPRTPEEARQIPDECSERRDQGPSRHSRPQTASSDAIA